jgi:hypothetical protein
MLLAGEAMERFRLPHRHHGFVLESLVRVLTHDEKANVFIDLFEFPKVLHRLADVEKKQLVAGVEKIDGLRVRHQGFHLDADGPANLMAAKQGRGKQGKLQHQDHSQGRGQGRQMNGSVKSHAFPEQDDRQAHRAA